jgi:hypothetical protein
MNATELVKRRIGSQKLSFSDFRTPVEVVRWFGAVQAQDFNGAKWALALRMKETTDAEIEAAFHRGEILRTHLLRPTWHFVAPEDIRWLLALTGPRINVRCGPNYRKYELDTATFKRSNRIISKALQSAKHLTRADLKIALNRSGVAADDGIRLAHILLRAELDGIVCSGPRRGKQFTYAQLEERVAPAKSLSHEEALATLTRRYFASHGPATLQDYIWWSGLTAGDARHGIALIESKLEKAVVNEKVYWIAPSSRRSLALKAADSQPNVHLLPAYDEYNVAYKDRDAVLDHSSNLTTWDMLAPTLSIGGRITGTWKAASNKAITLKPARPLKQPEKLAIDKAIDRYAKFLGSPRLNYSINAANFRGAVD